MGTPGQLDIQAIKRCLSRARRAHSRSRDDAIASELVGKSSRSKWDRHSVARGGECGGGRGIPRRRAVGGVVDVECWRHTQGHLRPEHIVS